MLNPTVSVIGLGYIGLPTAAVLAANGCKVLGVDIVQTVVDTINRGEIHIVEPDLDALVHHAVNQGRLRASTRVDPADAFLIAVPTPFKEGHVPDLDFVIAAARSIAPALRAGNVVILESTSPVGTTEKVRDLLALARPDLLFAGKDNGRPHVHVAYCPERVLPGKVLTELVSNDRVIGGLSPACAERARDLYRIFVRGECHLTDARTAEMCKLTENSFRDVNIAFANELSLICERLDIDVWELIRLANRHPRVQVLQPGPGVGGHCIAVDPWFIIHAAPEQSRLIETAREVNDSKPQHVLARIELALAQTRKPRPIAACLGLAFKADIDDLRESPALEITRQLARANRCDVLAVEPHIHELPEDLRAMPHVQLAGLDDALARADVVVGLVRHRAFLPRRAALAARSAERFIDPAGLGRAQ